MKINIAACLVIAFIFASASTFAQKTANYYSGTPGSANYQHYSFWTKNGKASEIVFAYGKTRKETKAAYEGPVNGIGTFCAMCAQDEKEAIRLLKRYYLK